MPNQFSNAVILTLALLSLTSSLSADPPSGIRYDNVGELNGAAFGALSTNESTMLRVLEHCGALSERLKIKTQVVKSRWLARNAKLQGLLPIFSERYGSSAPLMSNAARLAVAPAIALLMSNRHNCEVNIDKFDSGAFDIDSDPQIKIFLTESFKEFSVNGNPIEPIVVLCYEQFYGGDKVSAKSSCRRAAKRGGAYGLFLHGLMLSPSNSSDPIENANSRKFVEAAAKAGISDAQRILGSDYHKGFTGPVDLAQARYWYKKAIAQFDNIAPLYLGGIYIKGQGVNVDLKKGYAYAVLSARRGNSDALAVLSALADELELSEAARKSAEEQAKAIELDLRSKSPLFKGFTQ